MTKETAVVHVRLAPSLRQRLLKHRDKLRKEDPMANLSDVIRTLLEKALAAGL